MNTAPTDKRYRIIRADRAGYMGHPGYVLQVWSINQVWGDVGDPVDTFAEARAKEARERARDAEEATDG